MKTTATLDRCLSYLETQISSSSYPRSTARPTTITLSRMTGSGGLAVAERLVALLQERQPATPAPWTVFNRTLIEKVLTEHQLPPAFSRFIPENRVSYIEDTLEEIFGLHPSASALVTQISETILRLAEMGHCVLVGRGANVVLAKCETAFHVRLVGSLDRRVERIAEAQKLDPTVAREYIRTEDTARRRYVKSYFDAEIDDPLRYHLVINTDSLTIDDTAEIVAAAVMRKFPVSRA